MSLRLLKAVIFFSLVSQFYQGTAIAQMRGVLTTQTNATNPPRRSQFGTGILQMEQGQATTNRLQTFNALLSTSGTGPGWPSFPRIWHEEYSLEAVRTHTSITPKLLALSAGVEIDYRYSKKTSLVLITSIGSNQVLGDAESAVINVEAQRMLRQDPVTRRVFPIIREENPMVGFCSYELSLLMQNGVSVGLDGWGLSSKMAMEQARGVTHTVFSRFFQVPEGMSVQNLLNDYCEDTFRKHVREVAEADFVPVVLEETFLHSPKNQCHPSPKDNASGDYECMKWHSGFDVIRRNSTVPRCETTKEGFNVCKLKSKAGQKCPIYKDRDGKAHYTVDQFRLQPITKTKFAFGCDAGLSCKMTKQPKYFGSFPILLGEARCSN